MQTKIVTFLLFIYTLVPTMRQLSCQQLEKTLKKNKKNKQRAMVRQLSLQKFGKTFKTFY